jgi:glyoxylase-like metal-dependent hydrolase (beta-lactamase superfamily II)
MKIMSSRILGAMLAAFFIAAVSANAQGMGAAPAAVPAPVDYSKVQIKTTKLSGNLYALVGMGGTTGALVGPDGVLLVDTQFAPLTDKIVAAVRQISNSPIRFVLNTHFHSDHIGGNENLGKMGAVIFSRDELRQSLITPGPGINGAHIDPSPAAALPLVTYHGGLTFHLNGEEASVIPIPHAHTDGDSIVVFHNADVIMTGDVFRAIGYPLADVGNGGSLNGLIEGSGVILGLAGPNTKIVPGHGPTTDRAAVMAWKDMMMLVRDRVTEMIRQGKTVNEVIAAHITADFDAKTSQPADAGNRFIGQVYAELNAAK